MIASTVPSSLETAATRLAALLTGRSSTSPEASQGGIELYNTLSIVALERLALPADAWAVDGGQLVVADARCLQVVATRAARVRFREGRCVFEDEGDVRACLLGGRHERAGALAGLGLAGSPTAGPVDVALLRDRWEWEAVAGCVTEAEPGALVLVDGDLRPDPRLPASLVADLVAQAEARDVALVGVTKHSSLARHGAPLVGQLELEAIEQLGPRALWWARVGRTRRGCEGAPVQVLVARLDPDARFAFRVDLPAGTDPTPALGALAALCDDAAFPGYPYPLAVADRLAACPRWLRAELAGRLDELLDQAGVPVPVRERAFTDRHHLMERR